ncbi:MAG: spore coat protein [Clostridiales bacterium]|jgi:spore coat protein CotF|nr:spore coat protein [Clostridiales bacterium]
MNQNGDMSEKEIMNDVLSSQKQITATYNTYANECCAPSVRDEFLTLLNEEHQMQADVFSELQKRGWYQIESAEQQKIDQAKQKYQN